MEMTKQRKILMVAAGLGVGGLILDRLVLGPPESASADQEQVFVELDVPPAVSGEAQPADNADSDRNALPSFATLTERLIQMNQLPEPEQSDPFELPSGWDVAVISNAPSHEPVQGPAVDAQYAKRLRDQYKFYGTTNLKVEGGEVRLAVIKNVNGTQHFVPKGYEIQVRTGTQAPDGKERVELYRLGKLGSREVHWVSTENPGRVVVMQITVLGE